MIKKKIVTPGEEIAVIEEFMGSRNTYIIDGRIISKVVGLAKFDFEERIAEISPFKIPVLPRKNDIVYAQVFKLKDNVASLDVFFVEKHNKYFFPALSATLHVMNVSTSYIKTLYDVLGYGDIVRAKILVGNNPPYILSLKGRDFGVVYSNCPYCMTPLKRKGLSLFCTKCRRTIKRKISMSHYILT
ncbi:MAG: hypothetical protein B6U95_00675 [Thermofilum sp. ex4484_82]|nr:exosome complex RNA-binding protein Csl4 [Thermoproteales archaeon]OYT30317.1 MAG: hypothetical protein B6U95_00675 [Thermofilum sp. ex4484_82]OYT39922.1 MAG: hypothetical protein B6U96_00685 [Archaeoglobales archaeon ex4484_92]RLE76172.1 MAG: hypothetical protein DRZ80_01520 [Thermoprotei archaeon]RLE83491.1 MAG: hypothetical protein DRJ39_04855 [Thermoprotei archaeon]